MAHGLKANEAKAIINITYVNKVLKWAKAMPPRWRIISWLRWYNKCPIWTGHKKGDHLREVTYER